MRHFGVRIGMSWQLHMRNKREGLYFYAIKRNLKNHVSEEPCCWGVRAGMVFKLGGSFLNYLGISKSIFF